MSAPPPAPKSPQLPLVVLAAAVLLMLAYRGYSPRFSARPSDHFSPLVNSVDLNAADKNELLQIPGVGPSLADAILTHRQAVGRFDRVDDLTGVKGIGPKTLDKLRQWVRVSEERDDGGARGLSGETSVERLERKPVQPPAPKPVVAGAGKKLEPGETIDVNAASSEELQRLPGIGVAFAARIIAAREKKPFAAVEDLRRVSGIGAKTLEKLRPYVVVK